MTGCVVNATLESEPAAAVVSESYASEHKVIFA
jgi:hypothetical protein